MLSKNARWYKKGDIIAIFNIFILEPVFLTEEEFIRIQQDIYTPEEESMLIKHGILKSENEIDIQTFRKNNFPESEVMTLYLILTRDCNLQCDYCFEVERKGASEYKKRLMSEVTSLQAVDLFAAEYARNTHEWNYQIIFYGGEPAINWGVLKSTILYIRNLQKRKILPENLLIAMNTNGTLINKERAVFLSENNVSVCVSIDGTKEIHDLHRKDTLGNGTFDSAIKGYKNLSEANARVCPSFTISCEVVGNTLETIKKLCANLRFDGLGLNPLMCGREEFTIIDQHTYEDMVAQEIIDIFKWGRDCGVSEDRGIRKVRSIVESKPHIADCCAYGQQIVVQPDGSVGICHASSEHDYCTVSDYRSPYMAEISQQWINRLPIMHPDCEECEAIFICGGGCAHAAKLNEGSINAIDKGFCKHSKLMLEFLIWDLYEKTIARESLE